MGLHYSVVLFLASFLIWLMFVGLIVLWFIDGKIKKEQVVHALLASFIAWTATYLLKNIFQTVRPFELNNLQAFTLTLPTDPSFPSAHTAMAFALAITIWLHDRKVGILFVVLAGLVAWARVAANVHYPIDVVAGAILGSVTAILMEKVHLRLRG